MEIEEVATKTKWSLDSSHSQVGFKVKHLMITNVSGNFKEFDASIYTSGKDFLTSEIDFWINPASINTGDEKRDEYLRGADFFDAQKHKQITFIGNTFEKSEKAGKFVLYGDLTMVGITKQVKLDVEFNGLIKDPWQNEKAGFLITGKINRQDWGLTWNTSLETGGILVGDAVSIICEVQLVKRT